ncbi:isoleucine--tRNA ligase [Dokdonella fugitiva]|uniref:Isoleucine--tRNA ligase n=1 Tax=Dokdonella fugitiva TaxID=328517 RepID=A0A4R2IBI0_9GAMM|nr:isoleucine--tRNA ligase [Dokdonella fugitiva]TCO41874.1 isoleucyl-tRNA synthetase [Dokdonella fugitiva]
MSKDYKDTINLPKTDFAMKADLARREPAMLAEWERVDRYGEIQRRTAARERAYILHDGPPYANGVIHIGHAVNKILKDVVVKSKLLAGLRSPYVPGWDCHGLPIEVAVEKEIGKVGQKVDAATFRRKCREYAEKQIDLQRADFKRLGVLGDWDHPYRTMDHRYEADIIRALAKIHANGHVVRGFKPVHWCFDCASALAEAEIEYADKVSPAIDVAYDARDPRSLAAKFGVSIADGDIVTVPIWTTTPWTLPASVAVTLGPELEYALVEGPARGGKRVLLVVADALAPAALARYGVDEVQVLGRAKGSALENLVLAHPFYERDIPLLLGDHVSAEDGTGAVHTAPGHGVEDFAVGQKYGLVDRYPASVLNPIGGNGVYLPGTPIVEGQFIWKANDAVVDLLRERGVLLAATKITHSYPHCWRHKSPVAFRTTPQWFISMEKEGLRATALKAIRDDVDWFPAWGEERIAGMIAGRPDWCISRQRTWGVPIALFVDKATQQPHPRSVELMEQVAQRVEKDGVDAWYALDPAELLGADAANYEKVTDILDVWFDSGTSHWCVLDQRPELARKPGDEVMYLEGSDQHRGWFHSSLLTSAAMSGHAPYDAVLTHGFTVDAQGRKMSKSLGNVIAPQKVVDTLGADVLRLWVASTDYRNEIAVSDEILKRVADSYRRIRNTARFLLGNLDGFDPARDLLPVADCLLLDQWAVQQAYDVQQAVVAAYARHDFPEVVARVQNFCTNEMGALYLDITKDRLYTMPTDSRGRRSAQSAMHRIVESLVRWIAPILSFTAEEIWPLIPGRRDESVMFETWYDGLAATQGSPEQRRWWADLLAIRSGAARLLEGMRAAGSIGASLQAEVVVHADAATRARYAEVADELRFFFITSSLELADLAALPDPDGRTDVQGVELEGAQVWVGAKPSDARKCIRCWHYRPDVGTHAEHPEICGRCIENVDGAGEMRRWF